MLRIEEGDEPESTAKPSKPPAELQRLVEIIKSRGCMTREALAERRKKRQARIRGRGKHNQPSKGGEKATKSESLRAKHTHSMDEPMIQYNHGFNITPKSRHRPLQLLLSKRNGDIGPSWREEGNHLNILSEARLWRYGISVLKDHNKDIPLALVDQDGVEFPFSFVNEKFVIPVGRHTSAGLEKANFILDGGSHVHVVEADCVRLGAASRDSICNIGSYSNIQAYRGRKTGMLPYAIEMVTGWHLPRMLPVTEGIVTNEDLGNLLIESANCLSSTPSTDAFSKMESIMLNHHDLTHAR